MMFVIIMRVEEEKEVVENLEGRLFSTKSLFENPDMSIQLFKFFYGRLVSDQWSQWSIRFWSFWVPGDPKRIQ